VRASQDHGSATPETFLKGLKAAKIPRVDGTAVFLTRTFENIPPLLIDHVKHMGALQRNVITLTVRFEESPRVGEDKRGTVAQLGDGFWHVTLRFGFIEVPDLCAALANLEGLDPSIEFDRAIFFAARDVVVSSPTRSFLLRWRLPIFAFLFRNAETVVDRFYLPADTVVEVGRQLEL
jgi:KUP system potassium uptake protein